MGQPLTVTTVQGESDDGSRDLAALTSWRSDWAGLRVAVLGLGVTGFSVADTLVELGAEVLVVAREASDEHRELLDVIGASFVQADDVVPPALAGFDADLVVVSPGYDIELAWRLRDKVLRPDGSSADWVCITGTNGKTTTTQLTATMLVVGGLRAAPAGNIGVPVLDAIRDPQGFDVLVIELSSHQLHWINRHAGGVLEPVASVCLNLADDHLEWHGGREEYRGAKAKVYENTRVACVYNLADPATREMVEEAEVQEGCRAIGFGLGVPGPSDVGLVDGILVDRAFLDERHHSALELATMADLVPGGLDSPHMTANVLAAAALARAVAVEPAAIRDAIRAFRVDHHRTEVVAEGDGVTWVDDSKATNAHAADAALSGFRNVVWIAGGLLKGIDPVPLITKHVARLQAAVLIGADRSVLREAFERHAPGVTVLEVTGDETGGVMFAAVRAAASVARPGDVVLLAPAAASMDQFTDYADRGARFAEAVRAHLEGADRDDDPTSRSEP
ncbi:MAG: UDP-N-acetylmuramoyl-L-alanine--D-glutamate ligase [Leifsonia sp.]|nr:UDP-N-acetylmuramoyl-L-alanine--D-glutamate ligase [Leifsonia sp.]